MEIEPLDDAGALTIGREQADDQGAADVGDQVAAVPETRDQQTYRVEYRAMVEVAYSWDAAALELRQTWEAHEAKWSQSEDPGHADTLAEPGAWCGDGDRHLNPEANAEVERGCGRIREIAETIVTPAMRAIESEDPGRHLIGLEHRLKGTERLKEKVAAELEARPGLTAAQALASVPDAIRFTLCYSEDGYAAGVTDDLERLAACGFELVKPPRNSWDSDQYKGINTQWREPETGQRVEVQFHTWASFEAKQLSHAAYERIRNSGAPGAELDELEDYQRQVCAKIPIPPGSSEITYALRKERDA